MEVLILVLLVVVLVALVIGALSFKGVISAILADQIQKSVDETLKVAEGKNKEILRDERERMSELLDSRLKLGEQALDAKRDLILESVSNMRKEINQSQERLSVSDEKRLTEFENLRTLIGEHKAITETLQLTTDNLRRILSNNQMRGSFGQEVAEDLLKMAGFVKGQNYSSQEEQTTGKKPDFTVLLPNGAKINIDVKFPFQALQRLQETEDKEQQKKFLAEFKTDIKKKITEVTTRDYINPEENTVDFVIMFIPNEMIFSFIYEKFDDVWRDAMKQKVILCGPFGFTAILRMVQQSYENFKYQKDLHGIIAHIKTFETEYEKFSAALDTLGDRIKSSEKQFEVVSGVRDRALLKSIDKIRSKESLLENAPVGLEKSDLSEV